MTCSSCNADPCGCDQQFTVLDADCVDDTLMQSLIPTVDCVRDLYTSLGARTYQVLLVKTQWSGGERGVGQESVISEQMILPTPLVSDLDAVRQSAEPIGQVETGDVKVTQISPRYSEEQLSGLGPNGEAIPEDQSFYYEVRALVAGEANEGAVRRRFLPKSTPSLSMMKMQWTVNLTRVSGDRDRSGAARG